MNRQGLEQLGRAIANLNLNVIGGDPAAGRGVGRAGAAAVRAAAARYANADAAGGAVDVGGNGGDAIENREIPEGRVVTVGAEDWQTVFRTWGRSVSLGDIADDTCYRPDKLAPIVWNEGRSLCESIVAAMRLSADEWRHLDRARLPAATFAVRKSENPIRAGSYSQNFLTRTRKVVSQDIPNKRLHYTFGGLDFSISPNFYMVLFEYGLNTIVAGPCIPNRGVIAAFRFSQQGPQYHTCAPTLATLQHLSLFRFFYDLSSLTPDDIVQCVLYSAYKIGTGCSAYVSALGECHIVTGAHDRKVTESFPIAYKARSVLQAIQTFDAADAEQFHGNFRFWIGGVQYSKTSRTINVVEDATDFRPAGLGVHAPPDLPDVAHAVRNGHIAAEANAIVINLEGERAVGV